MCHNLKEGFLWPTLSMSPFPCLRLEVPLDVWLQHLYRAWHLWVCVWAMYRFCCLLWCGSKMFRKLSSKAACIPSQVLCGSCSVPSHGGFHIPVRDLLYQLSPCFLTCPHLCHCSITSFSWYSPWRGGRLCFCLSFSPCTLAVVPMW